MKLFIILEYMAHVHNINTIKIIFAPFVVLLHDNIYLYSSFCFAGTEILGTKRNYKYLANPASCADLTVIF